MKNTPQNVYYLKAEILSDIYTGLKNLTSNGIRLLDFNIQKERNYWICIAISNYMEVGVVNNPLNVRVVNDNPLSVYSTPRTPVFTKETY